MRLNGVAVHVRRYWVIFFPDETWARFVFAGRIIVALSLCLVGRCTTILWPFGWRKYSLVDVVHHFVVAAAGVDARNDAGRQAVHQLAQNDAIAQSVLEWGGRKAFANHGLDPVLSLVLLFWLPFASNLKRTNVRKP